MENKPAPQIKKLQQKILLGMKRRNSFAADQTVFLWKTFAPRIKEITDRVNQELYAVDVYPDPKFFEGFNPMQEYDKWAAVEVSEEGKAPEGMTYLCVPEGDYAVFTYKGRPADAQKTFEYIYGEWLPGSIYEMDDRPYLAIMGAAYKGDDPESEEEFWIPIKRK